jgi:hypothetical protein
MGSSTEMGEEVVLVERELNLLMEITLRLEHELNLAVHSEE